MDLRDVLTQLRKERDAINAAIINLERLEQGWQRGPDRSPLLSSNGHNNGVSHASPRPVNDEE